MIKTILKYMLKTILAIVLIVFILLFTEPLWNRLVRYPGLERHRKELMTLYKETPPITSLNTYRGVMHVHSYWSHDSEGTLHDLIPAAKNAGLSFIFLTDHPHGNSDTIPRGYNGYYDGVLIVPGSEKQGFATWPLDSTVIDWSVNRDTVVKRISGDGGIVFYSHPEEVHNWDNPYFQGMEIYNFHADAEDEKILPALINLIVNVKKYGNWAQYDMFDEQTAILQLFDSLNSRRKIVGYSAVDTHENQNIRARYLKDGRIEWMGPNANIMDTTEVTIWNKWLLSEPDVNGWIFKLMADTYMTGFNHITNYVLADALTEKSLADHIKKGHIYSALKYFADADGFMFYGADSSNDPAAIIGDSAGINDIAALKAVSPFPGQFRLIHNGKIMDITSSDDYNYSWKGQIEKGAYRMEVHLRLRGKYHPWIYTNPIYIF